MSAINSRVKSLFSKIKGKGAFDILAGTMLVKVASFFGSIILVRFMSKADYGVLGYMENLYTYAALFAGLGLNYAVFRYMVLKEDYPDKKAVFSFVVKAGTAINIIIVIVSSLAAFFYPHGDDFGEAQILLPLMLCAIPLHFLFDTGSYSLRALFRNREYAIASVFTVLLVWTIKVLGAKTLGLHGAALSWPVTYLVMSAVMLLYFYRSVFKGVSTGSLPIDEKKSMLHYSLQYMVTNSLWALFMQNDVLMIGMLLSDSSAVANYKVAYVFPAAIALISSSIGIFVNPYFIKHENDQMWVWRNYKRVLIASVSLLGLTALLLGLFAEPIIVLVYGDQYSDIAGLMRLLLLASLIGNGFRYTAANLLSAMGKVKINLFVALLGIAFQLPLNFFLIPAFGEFGAAIASVIDYTVMAIAVSGAFLHFYKPKSS